MDTPNPSIPTIKPSTPRPSFYDKNMYIIKAIIIFFLTLVLLIPTAMIFSLIDDREAHQTEAETEVMDKWAREQTITGPMITVPYRVYIRDSTTKVINTSRAYLHFLPEKLKINAQLLTDNLHRGIYNVPVYTSQTQISGNFEPLNADIFSVITPSDILWEESSLCLGITDLRGIKDQVSVSWDSNNVLFNPGLPETDVVASGISVPIKLNSENRAATRHSFSFTLNLKGSDKLWFIPVGKQTDVSVASAWKSPSFIGSFLPDERKVSNEGFTATWRKLNLNRNYPQAWIGTNYFVTGSEFGLQLKVPVETYQKTTRSVKYAIMVIGLTFMVFFFIEILGNKKMHPFQYILIGIALVIFYTLLLSISEHFGFNTAYIVAALMTILLVALYTQAIIKDIKFSGVIGGMLLLIYGFMFTIIQMEDFSLLVGSLGLFVVLSAVMYFSRKIDWYNTASLEKKL